MNLDREACTSASEQAQSGLMSPGLLIVDALFGLTPWDRSREVAKPAPPPPKVSIAPIVQKYLSMAGNAGAEIRPKVEGYLLKRIYEEGSFAEEGQALYQLDKWQTEGAVDQPTKERIQGFTCLERPTEDFV